MEWSQLLTRRRRSDQHENYAAQKDTVDLSSCCKEVGIAENSFYPGQLRTFGVERK